MSREPVRPISRAIAYWLRAMGEPETDAYDLVALEHHLVEQNFPAEAIANELMLWRRSYMNPIAPGSRVFRLSAEGKAKIEVFRGADYDPKP